jgi:hypothetical protein
MHRRKVMVAAAAIFAIGVAFAAQPISESADRGNEAMQERDPWVPGTNMLMSAHDSGLVSLAPPR